MKINNVNSIFWKNKRVLITGHSGFKGSWLSIWLNSLGSNVMGYSQEPITKHSLFYEAKVNSLVNSVIGDIRDYKFLESTIKDFAPEIIFHMAAQPLVRKSYEEPIKTYEINLMGTANLLEVVRRCKSVNTLINVTTDKCYSNKEILRGYKETDELGGKDPYSNSKACSELVTQAYRESFYKDRKLGIATARAGNVLGGGDWAEDRLIPDVLKSIYENKMLILRNPKSIRPWQYILDLLVGYILLAQNLSNDYVKFSGAWNFGPDDNNLRNVKWVVDFLSSKLDNLKITIENNLSNLPEAGLLNLDISKSKKLLKWYPKMSLEQTLINVIKWNNSWNNKEDMFNYCLKEIKYFNSII
tara:strand:- start:714 stop:1784 length:1071 start_codon:yes stop_codon:yes gene_type:complete